MTVPDDHIPFDARFKENGPFLDIRHAAYIEAVSIGMFIICWIVMAFLDGDWSWNSNMVSDFGISESSVVRNMFAMACAICGVNMAVCSYCIASYTPSFWTRLSYAFCIVSGILLVGVGLFDKEFAIHDFCAVGMCFPAILSMITMGVCDYLEKRYGLIAISASLGVICGFLMLFIPEYTQSVAIMCLLFWFLIRCFVFIWLDNIRLKNAL